MKCIILLIIIISCKNGFSQRNNSIIVEDKQFTGYIFQQPLDIADMPDMIAWYTPTIDEIKIAECYIRSQIKIQNKNVLNQGDGYPVIHKKLNKYIRQYFGYINKNGEKIIWVNCLWFNKIDDRISKEPIIMMDGGSYFWNIKVNMTKECLFDLIVNAVS